MACLPLPTSLTIPGQGETVCVWNCRLQDRGLGQLTQRLAVLRTAVCKLAAESWTFCNVLQAVELVYRRSSWLLVRFEPGFATTTALVSSSPILNFVL